MIVIFRWEDLFTGEVRRRRERHLDASETLEFSLADVAPTENLRIVLLDDERKPVGEIRLSR